MNFSGVKLSWLVSLLLVLAAAWSAAAESSYAPWSNGPSVSPEFFPIAVWLQNPDNAPRFAAAGINLYVGLWEGPTQQQLDTLAKFGMRVICEKNAVGQQNRDNPIIAGWMHNDEPDNAQWGGRFGPPLSTEKVLRHYDEMRAADPSRPVLLNLGQGVAHDGYIGRGLRRNHPEDYPEYVKGCDIASFDIYPVTHQDQDIAGKLEFVGIGVERLSKWANGKPVWNCIECTHVANAQAKATPAQVRAEVWMSLVHGSRGIIYFVHEFKPVFREAALLDDPEMLKAVTQVNHQILSLAPVLNGPTVTNGLAVTSSASDVPVATMLKRYDGATYLFAVVMRDRATRAIFKLPGVSNDFSGNVLGESRTVEVKDGTFADEFRPYEVHLYRIETPHRH
jgi:Beta-galactosidase